MWELDYKESWVLKNWCFWTVIWRRLLRDSRVQESKEIQPAHPKGNQSWIFTGRTDAEAETPILWSPDEKSWLTGKDPDAGKDWRQEEKVTTEDKMVGWHHLLNGQQFGWTPGVGDGQGGLACCGPWGHKELRLSYWTELNWKESTALQNSAESPQPFHACWIRLVQPSMKSLKLSPCKEVLIFQMSYSYLMNSLLELESDARMLQEDTDKIWPREYSLHNERITWFH